MDLMDLCEEGFYEFEYKYKRAVFQNHHGRYIKIKKDTDNFLVDAIPDVLFLCEKAYHAIGDYSIGCLYGDEYRRRFRFKINFQPAADGYWFYGIYCSKFSYANYTLKWNSLLLHFEEGTNLLYLYFFIDD